jgi:hypothetical protein
MDKNLVNRINNFIQKKLINPDWGKIYGGEDERYRKLIAQLPKAPKAPIVPKLPKASRVPRPKQTKKLSYK